MPRVLIGAAHTLESPGQIYGDLREADLTRTILKKVVPELEALKIDFKPVPLDLQLLDRIEWINSTGFTEEQGDIFVEIHVNDGGKRGIESWYRGNASSDNKSQILSEKINEVICKETGYENQGAKSEHEHELGALLILNQINCIGTTLELLYIDNEEDIKILKDDSKLNDLAKALAKAINGYLEDTPKTSSTKTTQPQTTKAQSLFPQNNTDSFFDPSGGDSLFGGPSTPKPLFGSGNSASKSSNLLMDREERKKMITDAYKKTMGKEPSQVDLNLYLNQGLSKEDLYAKLVESSDHEKIVKDAEEAKEIKDKMAKTENELEENKAKVEDLNRMMENFQKLLHHKNTYIASLQHELVKNKITLNGEYFQPRNAQISASDSTSTVNPSVKRRKGIDDFVMKILRV